MFGKESTMENENNTKDQLSRPAQYVFVGIAIAFSVLVIAATIFAFVTDV
jgi:preprotein translocase subunit Sec61beta